jgi:hypothetical protein
MNTAPFRSVIPTKSHFNDPLPANRNRAAMGGEADSGLPSMSAGIGIKFVKGQDEYIIWAAHMTDQGNKPTDIYSHKIPQTCRHKGKSSRI